MKSELLLYFLLFFVIVGTNATNSTTVLEKGESMNFTEEDIDIVIRAHNHVRALNITPPACDMQNITWDDNLADFAKKWTMNCEYRRKENFSMESWDAVGQNFFLAAAPWSVDFHYSSVLNWLEQQSFFTFSTGTCSEYCDHYVQLAYGRTDKVGCGASYCREMKTTGTDRKIENATFYMCAYLPPVPKTENDRYEKLYRSRDDCDGNTGWTLLGGWSILEKAIAGVSGGAALLGIVGAIFKFCKGSSVQPSSSSMGGTQGQNATNGKDSANTAENGAEES